MSRITTLRKASHRYLLPYHGGGQIGATTQTATAGDCYLLEFPVIEEGTYVDGITYPVDTTSNGNVIAAIFAIATQDTADGGALIVQSASTGQGTVSSPQTITFAATYLAPGLYYMALHFSSSTATFNRSPSGTSQVTGWSQKFNQAFAALPSTVPATTATTSGPSARVRVVKP